MTDIFKTMILILFCVSLCAVNSFAESKIPPETPKTQVVIIGTIHSAHYKNPKYSPDILRQIILSLKPDAILNELPLSLVEPDGRPLEKIRGKDNPGGPESWAADTVAVKLGIKQIPFDRPDRQENFKKTNYFKRQKQANNLLNKWWLGLYESDPNSLDLKIAKLLEFTFQAEASLFMNSGPEIINSDAHDSIIRIKHSVSYDILPPILENYPEYKTLTDYDHFARNQWLERNRIMADNVIKAASKYPGRRLVVLTGASHRYILRDLLKDKESIDLKEYWEIIEPNISKPEKLSKNIQNK